jgi:hypothetical protein
MPNRQTRRRCTLSVSWPGPGRDIDAYFPANVTSIQVNFGRNGHARAQLIQVALIRMEAYPYREPLHYP